MSSMSDEHGLDALRILRSFVERFADSQTDLPRPPHSLWDKLAQRIAKETGAEPLLAPPRPEVEPDWEEAAPGISVKLLATDVETGRVSLLVRLDPGAEYPPHRHAGVEELHLLQGELLLNERKLQPGDYIHTVAGTTDHRVWSRTGCTCFLITSTNDKLL